jgi:hypothetical protein
MREREAAHGRGSGDAAHGGNRDGFLRGERGMDITELFYKKISDDRMRIRRLEMIIVEMLDMMRKKKNKVPPVVEKIETYLMCEDSADYMDTWDEIYRWSEEKAEEMHISQDELGPEEKWDEE